MKSITFLLSILLAVAAMTTFTSCNDTGCTDPLAVNYDPEATESSDDCVYPNLVLHFHPAFGSEDFALGTTYELNGVKMSFDLFQFYISQVQLGSDGEFTEAAEPYQIVKAGEHMYNLGQVPAGHHHMLRFNVGVDSVTNHLDPTTYDASNVLAPQNPSMHWSWDSGYIFTKIEGKVDTDGDGSLDGTIEMHIGKDIHLKTIALEVHHSADEETSTLNLKMDLARFFDGIDLTQESITHTGDGPALAAAVANNAVNVFTVE